MISKSLILTGLTRIRWKLSYINILFKNVVFMKIFVAPTIQYQIVSLGVRNVVSRSQSVKKKGKECRSVKVRV